MNFEEILIKQNNSTRFFPHLCTELHKWPFPFKCQLQSFAHSVKHSLSIVFLKEKCAVITEYTAPQGNETFLYHVFKSICSIQGHLLLSIVLKNISLPFHSLPCWFHIQPLAFKHIFFYYQSNCTFHPDKSSLNLNYTHVVFYKHLHLGFSAL